MSNSALITMLIAQVTIISLTLYFYRKVLKTPKQAEPDSYSENDDESN